MGHRAAGCASGRDDEAHRAAGPERTTTDPLEAEVKRLFWMAMGATAATAGTRWTRRKAAEVAEQYAPVAVGRRVADNVGRRIDAAKRDGRAAMEDTESRLRARLRGAGHTDGADGRVTDVDAEVPPAAAAERSGSVATAGDRDRAAALRR